MNTPALRDFAQRFRLLVESVRDYAIFMLDPDGRVATWNVGAARIKGYAAEEIIGRHFSRFYPDDEVARGKPEHQLRVAAAEGRFEDEGWRVRKDGSRFWANIVITAVRGEQGELAGFAKVTRDLTERERAKESLRGEEEHARLIVDAAYDAFVAIDEAGVITGWNRQAERTFGWSRDEAIGQALAETIIPPQYRDAHRRGLKHFLATGEGPVLNRVMEITALRRSGEEFPVELTISPLLTDGKRSFAAFVRDISERKQADATLSRYAADLEAAYAELERKSEETYRSLVEHAVFGIYRSAEDGRLLNANPAFVAMLGYDSEAELLALDLGRDVYVDPTERERLVERYRDVERIEGLEVKWKRKGGAVITVRLSGRPLRSREGQLEGFEMVVEDVTARRLLEEQLRQSQKMEAVGRLAGGVAHDFNNVLTAIRGYAELLQSDLPAADPRARDLGEIIRAAEQAHGLTRQLLAFSRQQVLKPTVLDPNAIVTGVREMLGHLIGEDVALATDLHPAVGHVRADRHQLEQVLVNLAVNARDAMPSGGRLTITTAGVDVDETSGRLHGLAKGGRYVVISVSDTGVGMTAEVRARIFEPFFTTKQPGKGTGLGLATVYGIVQQSGGHVTVHSESGAGATFRVYLPRLPEGAVAASLGGPRGAPPRGTETILLVEDDSQVRGVTADVLQRYGYRVLAAGSVDDALVLAGRRRTRLHIVLTDVVMPGMDGPTLVTRLRELRPGLKALLMSGYAGDTIMRRGVMESDIPFLEKPFTVVGLTSKVREVLDAG